MHDTPLPSLTAVPGSTAATQQTPLYLDIRFDASTLLLGLRFGDTEEMLCASFPSVIGFRYMECSELAGFRQAAGSQPVWLFRVEGGGWQSEPGMQGGLLNGTHSALHEYLVLGKGEGVNVLCCGVPQVFPARQ